MSYYSFCRNYQCCYVYCSNEIQLKTRIHITHSTTIHNRLHIHSQTHLVMLVRPHILTLAHLHAHAWWRIYNGCSVMWESVCGILSPHMAQTVLACFQISITIEIHFLSIIQCSYNSHIFFRLTKMCFSTHSFALQTNKRKSGTRELIKLICFFDNVINSFNCLMFCTF